MTFSARVFAIFAALALSGCATMPTAPSSPNAFARQTKIDERALLSAELSYKAARNLMEAAIDSGQLTPGLAAKFFRVNATLNAALVRARIAYDAANAPSYRAALDDIDALIFELKQIGAEQESKNGR